MYGVTFNSCTLNGRTNKNETEAWCATEVDGLGKLKPDQWGYCEQACQPIKVQENSITIVTISIFAVLFVLSIAILSWYYIKRNNGKKDKDTILDGNIAMINSSMVLNEQAEYLSYSGKCEIDRRKFEIGQKLGGGTFGRVHEGIAEDLSNPGQKIKVAIKSVKNPLDPAQIYAMTCEIKVLDKLEFHLNLVNMMGACTTELKNGKIWLLLEYCPQGDMKNFLLQNRDVIYQGLHYHRVPHESLNIRLFINWSHGICKGMEYLASKNIMHGDLAARNILITKLKA